MICFDYHSFVMIIIVIVVIIVVVVVVVVIIYYCCCRFLFRVEVELKHAILRHPRKTQLTCHIFWHLLFMKLNVFAAGKPFFAYYHPDVPEAAGKATGSVTRL